MASPTTITEMAKRIVALEKTVDRLADQIDYQQAVEGIRRGLESMDRGEGETAKKVSARLHRKHITNSAR
jgi:predicted transcriptional regulator